MVIIDTTLYTPHSYIQSLSKSARQEFRRVIAENADLHYEQTEFDKEEVKRYMELWERQLVRGKPIQWAYPVETVENWWNEGRLLLFKTEISMHFIRKESGFWNCEPPMYDKSRPVGTYMWFKFILWAVENQLGIINMGGGSDRWREMIRDRGKYPNPKYKWRFIPKWIKDNPNKQPDYQIIERNGERFLEVNRGTPE